MSSVTETTESRSTAATPGDFSTSSACGGRQGYDRSLKRGAGDILDDLPPGHGARHGGAVLKSDDVVTAAPGCLRCDSQSCIGMIVIVCPTADSGGVGGAAGGGRPRYRTRHQATAVSPAMLRANRASGTASHHTFVIPSRLTDVRIGGPLCREVLGYLPETRKALCHHEPGVMTDITSNGDFRVVVEESRPEQREPDWARSR